MRPLVLVAALAGAAVVGLVVLVVQQSALVSPQSNSQQQQQQRLNGGEPFIVNTNQTSLAAIEEEPGWLDRFLVRPVLSLFGADDGPASSGDEGDEASALALGRYYRVPQGYLNYRRRVDISSSSRPEALVVPAGDERGASDSQQPSAGVANLAPADNHQVPPLGKCKPPTSRCNSSNMNGGQEQAAPSAANVKCHNNKYDRIIAQKIALNDISRPIVESNGRFNNPFPTWRQPSLYEATKFIVLESDESNVPKNKDELDKELPILKPDFRLGSDPQKDAFRVTWIGHATLLIQVDGLNIITDPMFSERASFSQYVGPKRIRQPACEVKDLPPIHIVLISHNHYDHLDTNSVQQLHDRFGNDCRWIVPLGLGEYLRSMSIENYVELDWWRKDCYHVPPTMNRLNSSSPQRSSRTVSNPSDTSPSSQNRATRSTNRMELDVYLTPTQHWTRRGVNDVNKSLWGSYVIVNRDGSTFFFGGDTAYCSAFKEIGKVFGPFAGAAIPIGAYKPRWFLKYSHVDVPEAVQIHRDLKSAKSIAIHHATFVLSNEPYKEPATWLQQIMTGLRMNDEVKEPFIAVKHGETVEFCKNC